jgi:hypothetical protein
MTWFTYQNMSEKIRNHTQKQAKVGEKGGLPLSHVAWIA